MRRILVNVALSAIFLAGCRASPAGSPSASPPVPNPTAITTKWIEVVISDQVAFLWEGDHLYASLPVSTGIGSSPSTTTFTGEFAVSTMYPGPEETAPGVFVRDIVIFDWEHGNGFHSLPMDAQGTILDETVGKPASSGCIRVKDSGLLYDFAETGMRVLIR